nr:hypothetical protein Q903MT_gene1707 [Picea sitchensis]
MTLYEAIDYDQLLGIATWEKNLAIGYARLSYGYALKRHGSLISYAMLLIAKKQLVSIYRLSPLYPRSGSRNSTCTH